MLEYYECPVLLCRMGYTCMALPAQLALLALEILPFHPLLLSLMDWQNFWIKDSYLKVLKEFIFCRYIIGCRHQLFVE